VNGTGPFHSSLVLLGRDGPMTILALAFGIVLAVAYLITGRRSRR
jgi:hypothetical protein